MAKKAKKTPLTRGIILCAAIAMLAIHILSWNVSPISLMITAAVVSLMVFTLGNKKGGERR